MSARPGVPGIQAGLLALLLGCANAACAQDDLALTPERRAKMLEGFREEIRTLDAAIQARPEAVTLYSRRGDAHLFLGQFAKAVADFEKMIALDPAQDAPHWRLGIAYYFAGQFPKSARQFEKYHAYDGGDRENGLWKYLADVKTLGIEPARKAMLVYTRFDREPFPSLYTLFAGGKSREELFAEIEKKGLTDRAPVMFFANYYAGLNEELHGRLEAAEPLLRAAVANPIGRVSEPTYMWQVARLHHERLAKKTP